MRYFIYCRKSTDSEDRQVLSLASQQAELRRAFTAAGDAQIVEVLEESKSAKQPGRPIFDAMLARIERGEADGILSWHPDRLARNAVDGGRLIHLLDTGVLKDLKFSTFTFENNSQGKFMLTIMFGYSKYYVDTLSENVKRGNRAKIERGWRPGRVPLGYVNDPISRTVVADPEHFAAVRRIFLLMLSQQVTVRAALRVINEEWGYRTPQRGRYHGEPLARNTLYCILTNPFYAGYFTWNGQLYPGKHEPMITMAEFAAIQKYISRSRPPKPQAHSFPFTGLIRCGACGLSVTAEHKVNRYGSRYTYYHCSRRSASPRCRQPSVDAATLLEQFKEFVTRASLADETSVSLASEIVRQANEQSTESGSHKSLLECRVKDARRELDSLTGLVVRGVIPEAEYGRRRRSYEIEVASAEALLRRAEEGSHWFEPALTLVSLVNQAKKWLAEGSQDLKRAVVNTVGSNYTLRDKKLLGQAEIPFVLEVRESVSLYWWSQVNDFRTRFESGDSTLLTLIERAQHVKAMAEAEGLASPLPLKDLVRGERKSRKDGEVADTVS